MTLLREILNPEWWPPKWSILGPIFALTGALGLATIGAVFTGSEVGIIVGGVEDVSADSGNFLSRISDLFPFGFAFSAGLVSSVNPCGFAMLPAYLGLYLGENEELAANRRVASRLQRAILVSGSVTAGFVLMFALVGVPISLGARGLVQIFPWIGLSVGVLLAIAGAYLLSTGSFYNNIAMTLSAKIGRVDRRGVRGYFTFGIGYGIASLSCTLPIFLAVIGGTFASNDFLSSLLQFLLYGFGMGTVIFGLTLSIAIFKGAMVGALQRVLPHLGIVGASMLLVSGAFIVYYWLTIGELLARMQGV